jgi:lipoprotein-anchoring transpeptidase ErfK/SrfK
MVATIESIIQKCEGDFIHASWTERPPTTLTPANIVAAATLSANTATVIRQSGATNLLATLAAGTTTSDQILVRVATVDSGGVNIQFGVGTAAVVLAYVTEPGTYLFKWNGAAWTAK